MESAPRKLGRDPEIPVPYRESLDNCEQRASSEGTVPDVVA